MFERIFPNNEHVAERVLRVAVGLAGISLVFLGPKSAWGWLGLVPLVTGLLGSCPLYTILGLSTCPMKKPALCPIEPEKFTSKLKTVSNNPTSGKAE